MKKIAGYWRLLKLAFTEFIDDKAIKLSASLAYYTVFSVGPLLLIIVSVAGLFFEQEQISYSVFLQIKDLVGAGVAEDIIEISNNMRLKNDASFFTIVGFVILAFGATGVFIEIQDSINYIFSIRSKPEKGWLKYLKDRLLSFSLVIGLGFLLIVSLVVNTVVDLLINKLVSLYPDTHVILFQLVNFLLLFIIISLLFAIIYKVLPDAIIRWKDAFVGAGFTTLLFILGKFVISYYLATSKLNVTYGAAASIILLLTWVYYTAIILYFGAEFTKVYAVEYGKGISVYKTAVFIEKKEVHELTFKKEEGTTEENKTLPSLKREKEELKEKPHDPEQENMC